MGTIYSGSGFFSRTIVGEVTSDGTVYSGSGFLSRSIVGEVKNDGTVYAGTGFGKTIVGKVDAPHILFSGAALLLLLR